MAKKVKITKDGQTVYPATVMDAVVHPDLRVDSSKLIEEVNVSKIYPKGGIDGTNKYTLETAIAKVPASLRNVGIKCSFLDEAGLLDTWEYQGGTFTNVSSWAEVGSKAFDEKMPLSHGNKYIKEMYLTGEVDTSHTFVLSRIARNHPIYKWAVYIKDINLDTEYYIGFTDFSSEPKYIDNVELRGITNCYMSAIINWDIIEDSTILSNLNLPLTGIFSLERNPYIQSTFVKEATNNIENATNILEKAVMGGKIESVELSGQANMTSTFNLNFDSILPDSTNNEYRIEVINGAEHIKPGTIGCLINGSSYYNEANKNIIYDETGYIALIKIADDDLPITTFRVQVGTINQVSVGDVTVRLSNSFSTAGLENKMKNIEEIVNNLNTTVRDLDVTVSELNKTVTGGNIESSELSGDINMTSTFNLKFGSILPASQDNRYRIEVISGQEHIKPREFGCLINGSYYIKNYDNIAYESDYSATIQVAEKDTPITTFNVQVGIPNQVSAGSATVRVSNVVTGGIKNKVESLESDVTELKSDVEEINEKIDSIGTEDYSFIPSLHICKNIYCVVGDKIQLYYDSFVHHIGDYSLNIVCDKGRNYKRYWEYTPASSDVGTVPMTIQLLDIDGKVIEEKQVNIVTKEAVNKSSQTNVLFVGDSLMMSGQQPIEVSRRLKGTTGIATSPFPLALSNFYIKGRKVNADQSVGWEGTGGWTWNSYLSSTGNPGIRFTVSDITDIRPGAIYTIQGFTQKVEISEINTTENTVFGIYYGKGDIYNNPELLPQTGSLTRTSGQGQETISYTSAVVETFQPFWNYDTDQFDISSYVDKYLDGHVEYICILLGSNSIIGMNPYTGNINNVLNQAKELITKIHEQLPDAIICVGTESLKSQNGGTGTSYAASGASGSYLIPSWNYKYHKLNDAYRTLEEDETFSQYVKVIDLCAQTDSEYAFNYTEVDVNTRVTTDKERRGTDGVHPNNQGYWMMADAWFRSLLCIISN